MRDLALTIGGLRLEFSTTGAWDEQLQPLERGHSISLSLWGRALVVSVQGDRIGVELLKEEAR